MTDTDEIGKSQRTSLIDDEIKKGESDEKSIKSQAKSNNSPLYNKKYILNNEKMINNMRNELCREKLYTRKAAQVPRTIKVPVYQKTDELPKRNYIPRHCMTKEEWMTFISAPNPRCSINFKALEEKTLKAVPTRINELAQPPRQRMVATLENRGTILPTPLVDRLITVLEAESSLTPEQVEKLFRTKRKKKKLKGKKNRLQMQSKTSARDEPGPAFDNDTIMCQYSMTGTFLKSILEWQCTIPKNEFHDITRVILNRLERLLHLNSMGKDTRRSQQMYVLAEIISAWVAGVLFEVAELREVELDGECAKVPNTFEKNFHNDVVDDDDDDDTVIDMKTFGDNASTMSSDEDNDEDNDDHDHEHDDGDLDDGDDDDDDDYNDDNGNVHHAGSDENGDAVEHESNKHNNGNRTREIQNEGKHHEKTDRERKLMVPPGNFVKPESEILAKILSNAVNETAVSDIVHSKTLSPVNASSRYLWSEEVGSESFIRRQFYTNTINQNPDNVIAFVGSSLDKSVEYNHPSFSIVEREINPNF